MGLFERIFGRRKPEQARKPETRYETLTAYRPTFHSWNGYLYESDLIRSVIDARARHISKLDVKLVGAADTVLTRSLKKAPNSWETWDKLLYRTSTILDNLNTAFVVPVVDAHNATVGYTVVLPQTAEVVEGPATVPIKTAPYWKEAQGTEPWLKYRFNRQTAYVELKRCAVLTKFQYMRDFWGEDNRALSNTMELINLQNQAIQEAVKSSATYRFMAQVNNFTRPDDLAKERKRFDAENLSATAESGGLLLFPNTYTNIQQIQSQPYTVDEAEMNEIRRNVYNYFGVNEDVLQNKAYGDAWSAFYEGAVEVFAVQFSNAMTRAVFSQNEIANGNQLMATANRLQYMTNKDKLDVSSQMADRGIMSRNEIREIWNLPPVPGGDTPTIRGEYYLLNGDGTTMRHDDDLTGGTGNASQNE